MRFDMWNFKDDSDKSNSNLENIDPAYIEPVPYPGWPDRWRNFKRTWSEEDKANLESVLKKVKINVDNEMDLNTLLTKPEMTWTTGFVWRAVLWEFYWKSIV
jgi:hypothetical protein